MKSERDRDRTVEQLLRRLPEGNGPSATDACAEADVLAAWVDGALPADEIAALEAHAAGCARCQALLAAMARTEIPAVHRPWWRSGLSVRWLVPLSAAAAMIIVWVSGRPANPPVSVPAFDRAEANRSPQAVPESQPPARVPQPADSTESSVRPVRQKPAPSTPKEEQSIARADADKAAKLVPPVAEQSTARERRTLVDAIGQAVAAPSVPAAPAPPPQSSPSAAPVAGPEAARFSAGRGGGGARAAAASPAVAGGLAESVTLRAPESALATRDVLSPDPAVRWRPRADGAVERSVDGGRTWELQQTGSPAVLTAGSSPAPMVCWLVGRAGVVLLSTDGRTWRRLSFPEPADLVAVRATDARTATVATADGRTFSTKDAGVTWATP